MTSLRALERPAAGTAAGALVFFHGFYGLAEDFLPFLDKLDPDRRLDGYLPQAPYEVSEGRASWDDRESALPVEAQIAPVAEWLDALPHPPGRTVLGGWSQGTWLAYVLALGRGRPRPAALLALGGRLPDELPLDLQPPFPAIAIAHGRADDAVPVDRARVARRTLEAAGANVLYRETEVGHHIDAAVVPDLAGFLSGLF
jgi:predicted esterase